MTKVFYLALIGLGHVISHLGERLSDWAKDKAFPPKDER